MKLLSIAVPCYNSAAYMRSCIDSLLCGGDRLEILIIDDGSTDETGAIADAYASGCPSTVRVIHQENQGHGGAINSAVAAAAGRYFKVVDSDDTLDKDALLRVLDALETHDVDMLVTNYRYVHSDGIGDRSIRYTHSIPENKIVSWRDTGRFRASEYLSIHSVIFRLDNIRKSGVVLPLHVFYEDNILIYSVLPTVKSFIYINVDFYNYTIGREGQSVQENIIMSRYRHQIAASRTIFTSYRLDSIDDPKLKRYMYHECVMLLAIAVIFTRLNRTEQAEKDIENMWSDCETFDRKHARRIRNRSLASFVGIKGKLGREIGIVLYRMAHRILRFN